MAKNYVNKYRNFIENDNIDRSEAKIPCELCKIDKPESHLIENEYNEKICLKCFHSKKCKYCETSLKTDDEENLEVCEECQAEFNYNEKDYE